MLPLDGRRVASADYWQRSAILCLQLGCRYYGLPTSARPGPLRDELVAEDIEMFVSWREPPAEIVVAFGSPRHVGEAYVFDLTAGGSASASPP